jgi:6,7-dimethyl-8-ribityllumazine synthase
MALVLNCFPVSLFTMASITDSNLFNHNTGILQPKDACVVLVRTEWNAITVDALEKGCREKLTVAGIGEVITLIVPGAFEIAFIVKTFWDTHKYKKPPAAFIALGCVLRGDTPHFDYVCKAVTDGVVQLNLLLPVPTIFGVLTVDNQQQADERIGGKHGHKGEEAALTALKMIALNHSLRKNKTTQPGTM